MLLACHQRETYGRAGLPVAAAYRMPLPADHESQDWPALSRAGLHYALISSQTGGGLNRSRLLCHSRFASRLLPGDGNRRRGKGGLLPNLCLVATHSALSLARALFNTGNHVLQDNADVPECHSVRRLFVAGFDTQQPSERRDGTVPNHRGELPNHTGAHQHEFG